MRILTTFDPSMAKRLAECANLAYEDAESVLEKEPNSHFFDEADTQAFLALGSDYDILAFRGTEPTNPRDWWTDIKFLNTDFRFGGVHRGFKEALEHVQSQIESVRQSNPNRPIYVTGHSLGAAVATLWVASQSETPNRIAGFYTFGSPRVGTSKFAKTFDSLFKDKTWRFQNKRDIATRVPKIARHVGNLLYFDTYGKLHEDAGYFFRDWLDPLRNIHKRQGDLGAAIADHSMKEYVRLVSNLDFVHLKKRKVRF